MWQVSTINYNIYNVETCRKEIYMYNRYYHNDVYFFKTLLSMFWYTGNMCGKLLSIIYDFTNLFNLKLLHNVFCEIYMCDM